MPLYRVTYRQPGSRTLWRTLIETDDPEVVCDRIVGLDVVSIDPPLPSPVSPSSIDGGDAEIALEDIDEDDEEREEQVGTDEDRGAIAAAVAIPRKSTRARACSRPRNVGREARSWHQAPAGSPWKAVVQAYMSGRLNDGDVVSKSQIGAIIGYQTTQTWQVITIQLDLALHRAPLRIVDYRGRPTTGKKRLRYETYFRVRAA